LVDHFAYVVVSVDTWKKLSAGVTKLDADAI
jgi:hypothetical protein